jgi:hypothetical protein
VWSVALCALTNRVAFWLLANSDFLQAVVETRHKLCDLHQKYQAENQRRHINFARLIQTDVHRMPTLLTLRLQLSTDVGNAHSSTWGLPCTHAGDISAPSAENADFVVIQTHLSFGF